jgi:hypothetical protein
MMANEKEDKPKKTCECDDPCDDCTQVHMSNLTGWIQTKEQSDDVEKS